MTQVSKSERKIPIKYKDGLGSIFVHMNVLLKVISGSSATMFPNYCSDSSQTPTTVSSPGLKISFTGVTQTCCKYTKIILLKAIFVNKMTRMIEIKLSYFFREMRVHLIFSEMTKKTILF